MQTKKPILTAKKCYGHIGGRLGDRIFTRLIALGWFEPEEGLRTVYSITEKGRRELRKLGVDLD